MSLDWNVSETPAWKKRQEEGRDQWTQEEVNLLDTLIWGCLTVDLPGMRNEEDVDEFHFRLHFAADLGVYNPTLPDHTEIDPENVVEIEKEDGTVLRVDRNSGERLTRFGDSEEGQWFISKYRLPTREEIAQFEGMRTNVSRKSRHQFTQRMSKIVRREVESRVERLKKEEVNA